MDPHWFFADPDPAFFLNGDRDPDRDQDPDPIRIQAKILVNFAVFSFLFKIYL